MLSYGLVIRRSHGSAFKEEEGGGGRMGRGLPRPCRNMHAQRIHSGLFLYVITFNRNIQRELRAARRRLCGFPSHLTSAYHPQTYRYACTQHRQTYIQTYRHIRWFERAYETELPAGNVRTLPFSSAATARRRPLFLSGAAVYYRQSA